MQYVGTEESLMMPCPGAHVQPGKSRRNLSRLFMKYRASLASLDPDSLVSYTISSFPFSAEAPGESVF